MKKNEGKMIILLIIAAIIIIAVLVKIRGNNSNSAENNGEDVVISDETNTPNEEFVEVLENGTKVNTSNKLAETKTVGNYEVSNIQLTEANGESLILADVKNIGEVKTEVTLIKITLLDKDEHEIMTVDGIVGDIEPGETVQLNTSATTDFANAYDFSIQIVE